MAQGWVINATADTITFNEAPAVGTGNIVVNEFASGGVGGSDVWAVGAWCERYGYPAEVEFADDRLWFAGTPSDPQSVWISNIGDYNNFGKSTPIVDSDAINFTINARRINTIRDLVPLSNMIVMTTGGEWKATGGADDVLTPSTVGFKMQSSFGINEAPAKIIGDTAIYVQRQGSSFRDLTYTFEKDGYRGNEISIWADHMVKGYTFSTIEYADAPWPVLWAPRSDGKLVGCTYLPEQEVTGWHRHDTGRSLDGEEIGDGKILDVCCLPGDDDETETYILAKRYVDGEWVQYIERLAPTRYAEQSDMKYVDSCLTYDGRNATGTTLTLSEYSGGGWLDGTQLTLTASASLFVGTSDEDDAFRLVLEDESIRVAIDEYVSATVVRVTPVGDVPLAMRNVALTGWTFQRKTIAGLDHLEGKEVAILSDGQAHARQTVTAGIVTLQEPGGVVQVGLPYRAHIETLEVNSNGGDTMRPMKKLMFAVDLLVVGTRGVMVGSTLDMLDPIAQREFEDYDEPTQLATQILSQNITGGWGRDLGRIHIVSDEPLPMEIIGIIPRLAASD